MHYSQRLDWEENVERRKKWLADKMCFACAEKIASSKTNRTCAFSVVGSYEVKKVFGTSSETKQIVIT